MTSPKLIGHIKKCSVKKQIDEMDDDILALKSRLRGLEDLLENANINETQRFALEDELILLRTQMDTHRNAIKGLHKNNSEKLLYITCFVFVVFFIFGLYKMFDNK